MGWIKDLIEPKSRAWEDFYRNRWQHDRVVRSTHGVNCTGGCSWGVYVKDGMVTWEMQQTDYPMLDDHYPPYEPRGCQRGISASWYVYSPIRVKYPYIRGPLVDFWRKAKAKHDNPVNAWASIVEDEGKRNRYQRARGKGGFRRASWEESLEIIAASTLYTARRWGPDRVFSFSPIPAMSYLSYAAGSRFTQLFGGANLSFYDWYADLPNSFPETWGDQTDVCESADWYNARYIVCMGANLSMTRTPDVHFVSEAQYEGAKFVVVSPDFSMVAKYADEWIPVEAGQDTAMWMAISHVILKEFHAEHNVDYFNGYLKEYTDTPFLIELEPSGEAYKPGRFLRAGRLSRYADVEQADWKFLVFDETSGAPRSPKGAVGHRWQEEPGDWQVALEDDLDDSPLDPRLSLLGASGDTRPVAFSDFAGEGEVVRHVPVREIETQDGTATVTTVFDLLMADFGVGRGLPGDYPEDYDDADSPFTPAWQEQYSGIGRDTITQMAREFATNAAQTEGRSMVIIGGSINHWYNNGLAYRGPITALLLCGCCGRNGGGMNHYVGQEKLTLTAPWSCMAFAKDWIEPPRLQQTPIWHYIHSDQWRYEGDFTDYASVPQNPRWAEGHAADHVARAVRMGWMPFYPQFNRNSIELVKEARAAGAETEDEIVDWVVDRVQNGELDFSVHDPDAEENWPRVWFIWRGNAIQSSAKGHEFFLKHYLGTHNNVIAPERAEGHVEGVRWHEEAPEGKMDLIVDMNLRMDTSALYSDIVLPAAMWYEKNDLNTTDLHSFVHPLSKAVPPAWEAKSDWDIFKRIAEKVSEWAHYAFPKPVEDLVAVPLRHDTDDELSQPEPRDWGQGECEPIPGKTMPHLKVVERDYRTLDKKFKALGRKAREDGLSSHGVHFPIDRFYDELLERPIGGSPDSRRTRCLRWNGTKYPSLADALDAANLLLHLAPETNGEVAYEAFRAEEERTGLDLRGLAEPNRDVRMSFADLQRQPRRTLTSPCWTGLVNDGRAYTPWALNVERRVPWRTLTGRQQLFLDHPHYLDFGEHLPTYKPKLNPEKTGDIVVSLEDDQCLRLNYITPHGKWNIHSTFKDNHRMLTLSRGMDPVWINDKDAAKIGIEDNDWVEIYNDNGVVVTRAAVSSRVQPGMCLYYHAVERTIYMPKSQLRDQRGGGHNSLTRTRVNPLQVAGGYAQWTYSFNYWGPIGIMTRDTYCLVRKLDKVEW